jgi:hypothetical protein
MRFTKTSFPRRSQDFQLSISNWQSEIHSEVQPNHLGRDHVVQWLSVKDRGKERECPKTELAHAD